MFSNKFNTSVNIVGIVINVVLIILTILGFSFPQYPLKFNSNEIVSLITAIALVYFNVFLLTYFIHKYEKKITISQDKREPLREFLVTMFIACLVWTPQFLIWRLLYKGTLEFWSTLICTFFGIIAIVFSSAAISEFMSPYIDK